MEQGYLQVIRSFPENVPQTEMMAAMPNRYLEARFLSRALKSHHRLSAPSKLIFSSISPIWSRINGELTSLSREWSRAMIFAAFSL